MSALAPRADIFRSGLALGWYLGVKAQQIKIQMGDERNNPAQELIEFCLDPMDAVQPWGEKGSWSLHWFGFSQGRYRLSVGERHLLNYSQAVVETSSKKRPDAYPGPWVDYYVVRLWEDLLEIVPDVLERVPSELEDLTRLTYAEWDRWCSAVVDRIGASADEVATDAIFSWYRRRQLDTLYLSPRARTWLWGIGDHIIIRWDNTDLRIEGLDAWSSIIDEHTIPRQDFIAALRSFDSRFISEMNRRVGDICANWKRDDIAVDFEHLRREQADRSGWLNSVLERTVDSLPIDALIERYRHLVKLVPHRAE